MALITGTAAGEHLIGTDEADEINAGGGNDLVSAGDGDDLVRGEDGDDNLQGSTDNDTLEGGADNDVLDGGRGNDIINGGDGIDVSGHNPAFTPSGISPSMVIATGSGWTVTTGTVVGTDTLVDVEIIGSASGQIRLVGNAGYDTLQQGIAAATAGNVVHVAPGSYDAEGNVNVSAENLSVSAPATATGISLTLDPGVQNVTLLGASNISVTGNANNNTITGNDGANNLNGGAGNDTLNGGLGNDTMTGGTGNDTFVVDSSGDVVNESGNQGTDSVQSSITYTLKTNFENLTLTGSNPINGTGNAVANTITGNDAANILSGVNGNDTLFGGGGNDRLNGGTGDDAMSGGAGDDQYEVDSAGDSVTENEGEGTDTVRSTLNHTLGSNVETLFLVGAAALIGTGNALPNTVTGNASANTLSGLEGNDQLSGQGGDDILLGGAGNDRLIGDAGNDTLDGGAGNDVMQGGAGNDSYIVDSFFDQVSEGASQGTDTVEASSNYSLSNNVENLTLTGTGNIAGIGNASANIIIGNDGNNALLGEGGNDTLQGGLGNDELNGGIGNDVMHGGAGNDVFSFASFNENVDVIQDFSPADDTLAFLASGFGSGLTSGESLVAGQTFIANSDPAATTSDGTFLYDTDSGDLFWDANGQSAGGVIPIAHLDGAPALTTADFLVV